MLKRDAILEGIKDFKLRYAIEGKDENLIAAVHLMNAHLLDREAALDQSSRSSDDHGVDAWWRNGKNRELVIYQSKCTESRSAAMEGLRDLQRAREWIETVLIDGELEEIPNNHCLYSLYKNLAGDGDLRKLSFVLLSLFDRNELLDREELAAAEREMRDSRLNSWILKRDGRIDLRPETYCLESGIAREPERYSVRRFPEARVKLRDDASLDLAYVSLHSLVELYRRRGDVLFHKNVRLSVVDSKETRARLAHPMEQTLDQICRGELNPAIFPFFHVGVTLRAASNVPGAGELSLEAPSIINGCQTITIASNFFRELEKKRSASALERFKQIQVVAKIVTGTSDDELREITNSNNRQIPIENWQLFSNDPIHIEIEGALESIGIFYERQQGRFAALMKRRDMARKFPYTNNTCVTVEELGQIVCLSRGNLQWAAKRSEIFLNRKNHDQVFDLHVSGHPHDVVFVSNLFKALKRSLQKYLEIPAYDDEQSASVFKRPIVRAHLYFLGLAYFYQPEKRADLRCDYGGFLNKIAPQKLVEECKTFYMKIVSKVRTWYLRESKQLKVEVAARRLGDFAADLAIDLGVSIAGGAGPFSGKSIAEGAWSFDEEESG